MKYDNELIELNDFLMTKYEDYSAFKKILNNKKYKLLKERIKEIETLKKGLIEIEISDNENSDELEYLNEVLILDLEVYKNFKKIISNKRYKKISLLIETLNDME